ncbi:MAG: STAS domain-containing protein [Vicinamibacterales bacterium]
MDRVMEKEHEAPGFGVDGRHAAGVTALKATGRLVAGSGAGHPAWQLGRDWRGAAEVVVDLADVSALDAGGVGALLRLRQSAARHGVPVTIAAAGPRVRRVLQLCRLDALFGLADPSRRLPRPDLGALCRCA